jgi:thiamine biosynthesis protein ThiS
MRKVPDHMTEQQAIQVTVNGKPVSTRPGIPVPDLLQSLDMNPERVIVEWNGMAKTREESAKIELAGGDVLEVVRIVAGG